MSDSKDQHLTVWERIVYWSKQDPDRNAYVFRSPTIGRATLTRRELQHMGFTFAERLAHVGTRKGDVVCNTLQNSPERLVTDVGIMSAGAATMDKRVMMRDASDLIGVLNKAQVRLVIVDPKERPHSGVNSAWDNIRSKCSSVGDLDTATSTVPVRWPEVESLERVMFCPRGDTGTEFEFLKTLKDSSVEDELKPQVQPDDLAVLFLTSGSTGVPKLAMFTNSNVINDADTFQELFLLNQGELIFQDRPVGWNAAFQLPFLSSGATRVMTDGRTQPPETYPDSIWGAIAEEGVTFAHLTPQMVSCLLAMPDLLQQHKVRLRRLLMAGQPLKKSFSAAIGTLCDAMYNSYGLTECGYLTSGLCQTNEDFDDFLVGQTVASTEIRIVDENFQPVSVGQTGQVLARSKCQFRGYYHNEEMTKRAILADGWMRTDDLGCLDQRGRYFLLGRQSDAIMRGVVIVYPHRIESRLAQIPGVQDVMVVGVPHPELYQEICACVVLTPDSLHTAESLKEESDAILNVDSPDLPGAPKFFLIFDAFPTIDTGKASRKLLQGEAAKILGLAN